MNRQNIIFFNINYLFIFILSLISMLFINDNWNLTIVYLVLFYLFILFFFLKKVSYKHPNFPLLDIRVVSAIIIGLYILIPIVGYVVSGFQLNELSDNRLRAQYKINTEEIAKFHINYYLPFFLSFVLSLILLNRNNQQSENKITFNYPNALLISTIIFLFIFESFFIFISIVDNVPLFIKQLNNIFGSFRLVCYASLIFYIFLNWKNKFVQLILLIYLTYLFYGVFNDLMSRTVFFKTLLAMFFLFNNQVYRFNIFQLFFLGISLFLLAFIVGGLNTNLGDYLTP